MSWTVDLAQIVRPEHDLLNQTAPLQPRVGTVASLLWLAHSGNYQQWSRQLAGDLEAWTVARLGGRAAAGADS